MRLYYYFLQLQNVCILLSVPVQLIKNTTYVKILSIPKIESPTSVLVQVRVKFTIPKMGAPNLHIQTRTDPNLCNIKPIVHSTFDGCDNSAGACSILLSSSFHGNCTTTIWGLQGIRDPFLCDDEERECEEKLSTVCLIKYAVKLQLLACL